jgi:hypothetical protein
MALLLRMQHLTHHILLLLSAALMLLFALFFPLLSPFASCRLAGLDWEQLSLDTLFVDPPRAGLDEATVQLLQDFQQARCKTR